MGDYVDSSGIGNLDVVKVALTGATLINPIQGLTLEILSLIKKENLYGYYN